LPLHKLHPRLVTLGLVAYEAIQSRPDLTGQEFARWAGVDSATARKALRQARAMAAGIPAPSRREAVGA
jgi:hypothetical protein